MGRKTPDERALPRPGRISRDQAWAIVVENDDLVKKVAHRYVLQLTGHGRTAFAGFGPADLFDELIGAAYEGALIAAEHLNSDKENFNPTAYLGRGAFRYMKREAEDLLKQRGLDTLSLDRETVMGLNPDTLEPYEYPIDLEVPSAEDEYLEKEAKEEHEVSVRSYVTNLLMASLTEEERRFANVIIKGDKNDRVPFFSGTFVSLRDKLIRRAAWMEAEGFGVPDGWGDTIARRIEQRAKEWATDAQS
jgi:hypothetical protein